MHSHSKKKFAVVGTGGRVPMFIDPIARDYTEVTDLVGLCDASPTRAAYHQERLQSSYGYHDVPVYDATDFERMIEETRPDVVIVCTVDATHHEYIIKALDLGCDVVTEKPLTTDVEKYSAIYEAVERSGKNVRVAFNYRWGPGATKVREIIASGTIGTIKHVNLEYTLDTSHGADYFRRWHANKQFSGGLLVHKSTHHFDLVNWWIDAVPSEVFAYGALNFYGKENALQRGDEGLTRYNRYQEMPEGDKDPFFLDLQEGSMKSLYLNAEGDSGYVRDRNVFREDIDIEDTMSVLVKYRTGVVLNYSLIAYSPVEGFRVTFSGDRGRLEYTELHGSHIIMGQSDTELAEQQQKGHGHHYGLRVTPLFQAGYDVEIVTSKGGHGGGDPLLQEQIFSAEPQEELFGRSAGYEQGGASILVGVAANASIDQGTPIRIADLFELNPQAQHLSQLV